MFDLSDRVALVTGGGRGIGAAISHALADAGAAVAVNYVANADAAQETVSAIEAAGGRAVPVQGDVTVNDEVVRMVSTAEAELGPVDILIANAGIGIRQSIEETTEADFNLVMQANLTSAFLCSQAVVAGMRERGWGRLIYITSGAAHNGGRVGLHYSASKGGMEALARAYALRLVEDGVTANSVSPVLIHTDMTATASPEQQVFSPPVGRMGHVDEVASAVVMLAANGYMTGQTVHMNGGLYFT
ncbi:MAG: SDR family NAD(P)-dependent oxidoreductase [Proteobacteria bacterium]|nr:SDR family NAD(P)-dependent oxidoreductase [Pseudomonadota bacterium]